MKGYNGFPQVNTVYFKFCRINTRSLVIIMAAVSGMMDRFKYFREITTVTEKKWMTAIDIVKQQAIFQYIHA